MSEHGDKNTPDIMISVVTPTLNEENLLPRFLLQFTPEIKQKYKIELIISDGGSKDNTIEIAKAADLLVTADPNRPQNIPIGRNSGADAANGKYLYIITADTRFQDINKFFDTTIAVLNTENYSAICCPVRIFPEEENTFDKIFHSFFNRYVQIMNLIGIGMGRGECQIVRKDVFKKIGGYNEQMFAGEDFDLYRRIRKYGKIKFVNDIVIYESPRRYRRWGYCRVLLEWLKNGISVIFRKRSHSDKWEQIR